MFVPESDLTSFRNFRKAYKQNDRIGETSTSANGAFSPMAVCLLGADLRVQGAGVASGRGPNPCTEGPQE